MLLGVERHGPLRTDSLHVPLNYRFHQTRWSNLRNLSIYILIVSTSILLSEKLSVATQSENNISPEHVNSTDKRLPKCDIWVDLYDRYDCHPDQSANEQGCLARGCCWDSSDTKQMAGRLLGLNIPSCYFPSDYTAYTVSKNDVFMLHLSGKSGFKEDVVFLYGKINNFGDFINIKIHEYQTRTNEAKLPKLTLPPIIPSTKIQREKFLLDYDVSDDSILTVRRTNTSGQQGLVFRTNLKQLIFSKNFIQLNIETSSNKFFGLGQQFSATLNRKPDQNNKYTMFNYGIPPEPKTPTYTSYPFYINYELPYNETEINAHGVYMHNSHAMDVIIQPTPAITWRTLGGIIDMYIFCGPTPHEVIQQYVKLVGLPALPPMWALGFHLSRNNYDSSRGMKLAWARTVGRRIPLDGIWTDIDFMTEGTSFTWNSPEAREFLQNVYENHGVHHVPIVNPGISVVEISDSYKPYELGKNLDIFIKLHNQTNETLVGLTWTFSKKTVFIDYTHTNIVDYLSELLKDYETLVRFDGLWLDMNEPEMFIDGSKIGCPVVSELEEPQYQLGNSNQKLNSRTLCMSAVLQSGLHYELHNIYAFYQSIAFREALKKIRPNKRPFLVSRAQFSGQGKYSGSWLGDIRSSFDHMKWSITAIIQSNWYGQPEIGGDICGYFSTASDELCARWSSLGAFYPLARNHNDDASQDQDPGSRGETVSDAALSALWKRYSLLPYLYTLFYQNHLLGLPVIRSISFEFFRELGSVLSFSTLDIPTANWSEFINDQFLWGPALMIAPIVEENSTKRHVFLPPGRWFDVSVGLSPTGEDDGDIVELDSLRNDFIHYEKKNDNNRLSQLTKPIDVAHEQGTWLLNLETPMEAINLYLRAGYILATFSRPKATVFETVKQPFTLEVALNRQQEASGELYWDSGESPEQEESYNHVEFKAKNNKLTITMIKESFQEFLDFEGLIIYGLESKGQIAELYVNNQSQNFNHYHPKQILKCRFNYGETVKTIRLEKEKPILIEWTTSSW